MPIQVLTLPAPGTSIARCEGNVCLEDMIANMALSLPSFKTAPSVRILVDLRPITDLDLTFKDLLSFIPMLTATSRDTEQTFQFAIVSRGVVGRAIVNVFQLLTRSDPKITVHIHPTISAALDDLGLAVSDLTDLVGVHAN